MKRALPLSHTQENPKNQFPYWTDFQFTTFQKQSESDCRSTGRSTDPSTGRPCRSTVPNRDLCPFSRLTGGRPAPSAVDRAVDRSPSAVDRTGRPLQPVHVGAQRSTGPVDRAAAAAADSLLLLLMIPCLVFVDFLNFLSLPTSYVYIH